MSYEQDVFDADVNLLSILFKDKQYLEILREIENGKQISSDSENLILQLVQAGAVERVGEHISLTSLGRRLINEA